MTDIIFLFIIWWLNGLIGFVYWWTSQFDLDLEDFFFGCLMAFMGPLTWLAGAYIHRDRNQ